MKQRADWSAAIEAWTHDLLSDGRHPNLAGLPRDVRHLRRVAEHTQAAPYAATGDDLTAALAAARVSPVDRIATLVALRRFYTWATDTGLRRSSPLATLPLGAWERAVADFAQHLDRTGRPSLATAETYARRVFTYGRALPCSPWDVTGPMLQNDMDTRDWSSAYRKSTLVALRSFYRWAVQAGRVERSPLHGVTDGNPARPGPMKQQPSASWREPVRDYLTTMRAGGRRPATVNVRRWHLTRISHEFSDPWAVTSEQLALFLSADAWSAEHRRAMRGTLRLFYRWAVLSDRLDRDPTLLLASVPLPRALPRPAPDDAVLDAFERADDRTRLAIELGMYAGLRIGEVVGLQHSDVMPDRIRVTGKGGHQRMVPLHPTLAASLSANRSRCSAAGIESPWLFPSPSGTHLTASVLGNYVSAALPGGWTHHTLRHRFATQAYASTRDLRAVQELLGHVRPETTARYAAVPDGALLDAVSGVGLPLDRNRKAAS